MLAHVTNCMQTLGRDASIHFRGQNALELSKLYTLNKALKSVGWGVPEGTQSVNQHGKLGQSLQLMPGSVAICDQS